MTPQLIKSLIAVLLLYLWGWIDHRLNVPALLRVPKVISILCGSGKEAISRPGIVFQWLGLCYFIGLMRAVLMHRPDLIVHYGLIYFGIGIFVGYIFFVIYDFLVK